MTNYKQYFKNKKITVMGLGLLGRGIGVTKFLADCGADLIVTDLKDKKQLAEALKELRGYKNIKFVLGEHRLEDFVGRDMIIRAANVPLGSPYIKQAEDNNVPVKMDASLFLELAPKVFSIGVTGTRGKSTVTHLIHHIISKYLQTTKTDKRKLYLAGNVRGTATLPLLKKVKEGDIVLFELDSWQLQGFGDSQISPHVAVFTNLMADHLNYYQKGLGDSYASVRQAMKLYFNDKKNIYRFQTNKDFLILGKSISPLVRKSGGLKGRVVAPSETTNSWPTNLLGRHNKENIALAVATAKLLKIPGRVIKEAVKTFKPVPGRLEFVRDLKGVKYYNDTTATMPDATISALEALEHYQGKIILIGGGNDKNLDYKKYGQTIPKYVKKLVLLPGAGTEKIKKSLPKSFGKKIVEVDSMKSAVREAKNIAHEGEVVILSPGASSFGPPPGGFKNEFDRGDQFVNLVKKLK